MNGDDPTEDGNCTLKVIQQPVTKTVGNLGAVREPLDNLDFELSCNRGAPSYNMGYATDTILFESYSSKMAVWSSPYGDCHLVFEFSTIDLVVSQIGYAADCGFGGTVYASGKYQLEDSTVPQLGCMEPSNPCE